MVHIPRLMSREAKAALNRIETLSGQNISKCMQCGTCSAVCPMAEAMGATPRQAMLLLQFGRIEEVMEARIGGLCASCHTCEVRCPRGIEVPRVFEAVRLLVLRNNVDLIDPREVSKDTMAKAPQIALVSTFRKLTA